MSITEAQRQEIMAARRGFEARCEMIADEIIGDLAREFDVDEEEVEEVW